MIYNVPDLNLPCRSIDWLQKLYLGCLAAVEVWYCQCRDPKISDTYNKHSANTQLLFTIIFSFNIEKKKLHAFRALDYVRSYWLVLGNDVFGVLCRQCKILYFFFILVTVRKIFWFPFLEFVVYCIPQGTFFKNCAALNEQLAAFLQHHLNRVGLDQQPEPVKWVYEACGLAFGQMRAKR